MTPSPRRVQESMKKHSVNGYLFCQQPSVAAQQGQLLRLVLMGVGGETDMHTPVFTDNLLVSPGGARYTRTLLPGSVRVVELTTGARRWPGFARVADLLLRAQCMLGWQEQMQPAACLSADNARLGSECVSLGPKGRVDESEHWCKRACHVEAVLRRARSVCATAECHGVAWWAS